MRQRSGFRTSQILARNLSLQSLGDRPPMPVGWTPPSAEIPKFSPQEMVCQSTRSSRKYYPCGSFCSRLDINTSYHLPIQLKDHGWLRILSTAIILWELSLVLELHGAHWCILKLGAGSRAFPFSPSCPSYRRDGVRWTAIILTCHVEVSFSLI